MGAKHFEEFEPERLVKSTERVRDLGEVFTPASMVDEMLDLLPVEMWQVHPAKTFLEPSVGNGNFVSAVLSRKLTFVDEAFEAQVLPAGTNVQSAEFHALEALSSIYGVDISEDNIIGGTAGHEVACRPRLLKILERWHSKLDGSISTGDSDFMQAAAWIVNHNMIIGNMLARDAHGKPTGRDDLVVMEYDWHPEKFEVEVGKTTMGSIIGEQEESHADVLSLFGYPQPEKIWLGSPYGLFGLEVHAALELTGRKISNSKGDS